MVAFIQRKPDFYYNVFIQRRNAAEREHQTKDPRLVAKAMGMDLPLYERHVQELSSVI